MIDNENERIPSPIADDLRPALSQERSDALWRRIANARDAADESPVRRVLRSPGFAVAAAALVMIGGLVLVRELRAPELPSHASRAPLTRMDGHAIEVIAPQQQAADVPLSDGSSVWVAQGAVLAPLDVSDHSVVLHLLRGRSRFAVKPGGPRRWVVEAGLASVEVVGTRFSVDRDALGVVVQVEEGKVLVRSAALPDGVARLAAGQTLRVPSSQVVKAAAPAHEEAVEVAELAEGPGMEPASQPSDAPAVQAEPAPAVAVQPAKSARPAVVVAPPEAKPVVLDADALFAIADDARMTRDYRGAIVALERVIREHGADPRAKLAAFTIGRIRDEHLRDLAGATNAYEQALSLGLSGSLAEDCYSRLLRVLNLQSNLPRERVERAAQQYLQRYPKGRYAAEARGLAGAKIVH